MTALILFFVSHIALAQPVEVDVGPPLIENANDVTIVDRKALSSTPLQSNENVFRSVPGLSLSRSGGEGQPGSIFIRGGDSAGTLVLLDGLPVNDPSLSNAAFDFSTITLSNIERIEVLKGPQSVVYGSGATGGVINIVTRKGEGPNQISLEGEAGSQNRSAGQAWTGGSNGDFSYSLAAATMNTNGISASGAGELDSAWMNSLSGRGGWRPDAKSEIEVITRWTNREAGLDYAPSVSPPYFLEVDAPNYRTADTSLALSLVGSRQWTGDFHSRLQISRFAEDRSYRNDPDGINNNNLRAKYDAEIYRIDNTNHWRLGKGADFRFGPRLDYQSASSDYRSDAFNSSAPDKSVFLIGAYGQFHLDQPWFFITAGLSADHHRDFGDIASYELKPGVHVTSTTDIGAGVSSAFKAPTIFELYDPLTGNSELHFERANGGEIYFAQSFDERRGRVRVTGFQNRYSDLIQFVQNKFINVGASHAQGVETEIAYSAGRSRFLLAYTYLESRNDSAGGELLRRPRHLLDARADLAFSGRWDGTIEYMVTSARADVDALTNQPVTDAGYSLVNASLEWSPASDLKIYVRGQNLADIRYEDVAGYGTYGRSIYLGGRWLLK